MTSSDRHFNHFPDGLPDRMLELEPTELLRELGRPTLVRIPGTGEEPPRAVATLLHGDEDTGYHAMLHILRRRRRYPFDLYLIIGNVQAALAEEGFRHRFLDEQEDFNRIWGREPTTRLRLAADGMLSELREAKISALVDVHNNSGTNPFYAIVTRIDAESLNLATKFTTTVLHWDLGVGTLMEAVEDLCPSIAVECGLPGRSDSLSFAVDGLRRFLAGPPPGDVAPTCDLDLLGEMRKVTVRPEVRFAFGGELSEDVDFVVEQDADAYNFRRVPAGHLVGCVPPGSAVPLQIIGPEGADVTGQYVTVEDGRVITVRPITPVMMTRTAAAARKDCLFYVATPREHHS
jgi:hypothetical protein